MHPKRTRMYSEKEKYDTLQKILNSKTFSKSTTTNVLLKFLVECTIQNKEISAYTIGRELFGNNYDQEKTEVNARVNIYHLRKKLTKYYDIEGINDLIVISITSGQYSVTFSEKENLKKSGLKKWLIIGSVAFILILLALLVQLHNNKNNHIWTPLFNNDLETTLYLGDLFGYTGPSRFGHMGWHRDFSINSSEDFITESKKAPEKFADVKPAKFNYVVFDNVLNIKPFTKLFTIRDYDFSINTASDFKIRSIKDRNTIYAGPLFLQSPFNELFNNFANNVFLELKTEPYIQYTLNYTNEEKEHKTINIDSKKGGSGEYAVASVFNGPNNSRHYMFFSDHGMGLLATIEYFTNIDSIRAFSEKHLQDSNEFIAIFFVKGIDRTNMSMELVFIDDNK